MKQESQNNPRVFISYSWDNEVHKKWVLNLANRLSADGIDVILDRYYLNPGKSLPHFVESSIDLANRIIIIFTPNYKLKADKRAGGVGYEYSIMNAELYENQTANEKVIPILRAGNVNESVPTFMQQFILIDIREDNNFESSYLELIREIYNEPAITKPKLGVKPIFEELNSGKVEKKEPINLSNWKSTTNYSTPQWTDYVKIPFTNSYIKRIRCNVIPNSDYYRFGFKLFRNGGKIFGDGSIQSLDNNLVIHVGKNIAEDELFITTYRNGIRQRPNKYTGEKAINKKISIELLLDEENVLHFFLNDKVVHKVIINKEIREQIYMMVWGDENEYELSVENIEIESVNV